MEMKTCFSWWICKCWPLGMKSLREPLIKLTKARVAKPPNTKNDDILHDGTISQEMPMNYNHWIGTKNSKVPQTSLTCTPCHHDWKWTVIWHRGIGVANNVVWFLTFGRRLFYLFQSKAMDLWIINILNLCCKYVIYGTLCCKLWQNIRLPHLWRENYGIC